MDLTLEHLDNVDIPLSNEFWGGFTIGIATVGLCVAIAVT